MDTSSWRARTRVIALGRPDKPGEPLNVPIVGASTFALGGDRDYARGDGTPTWEAAEAIVGDLEGGSAVMFASGMGAVAAALDLVPVGGRVAAPADCYLGTAALLRHGRHAGRWRVDWLEPGDTGGFVAALADHDMVWLESPTNPMMQVMDLPQILGASKPPTCRTVVDNTFPTPLGSQPLGLGADIVVHSATKYLGGHSDLLAGIAVAASERDFERLTLGRTLTGGTPGMLEAFLLTRGLRTLALRVETSSANAATLAARLAQHSAVETVRYPGSGSMLSFDVRGGAVAADAICRALRLITHATSLGGVESTIERRGALPGQEHVPAGLLRLSTGCEDPADLWDDLVQALGPTMPIR